MAGQQPSTDHQNQTSVRNNQKIQLCETKSMQSKEGRPEAPVGEREGQHVQAREKRTRKCRKRTAEQQEQIQIIHQKMCGSFKTNHEG